jgi:chaperone modulatory protein CbpM
MELQQPDVVWLDDRIEFSLAELGRCSGLSDAELRELIDYGVLAPTDPQCAELRFGGDIVVTIRTAKRLRDDLELDPQTLALALTLIGRIHELEAQVRSLQAQLPHRFP